MMMHQQGNLEEALHLLLTAGVGLALMHSPDMQDVEEALARLRAQMGEKEFDVIVDNAAREAAEVAYGLGQEEWEAGMGRLSRMLHAH
jgi:hypothetical protein